MYFGYVRRRGSGTGCKIGISLSRLEGSPGTTYLHDQVRSVDNQGDAENQFLRLKRTLHRRIMLKPSSMRRFANDRPPDFLHFRFHVEDVP